MSSWWILSLYSVLCSAICFWRFSLDRVLVKLIIAMVSPTVVLIIPIVVAVSCMMVFQVGNFRVRGGLYLPLKYIDKLLLYLCMGSEYEVKPDNVV